MDRNDTMHVIVIIMDTVALRKESVDRNTMPDLCQRYVWVALRKESVDRNPIIKAMRGDRKASLSARRAWIEIPKTPFCS